MAFTYDVSNDAGKVRLIITDTDSSNPLFQDDEIDAYLALKGGSILLAAAQALDTIASSEALILKKIRLLDVATDGPAVAKALRDHAKTLREQYIDEDGEGAFDIAQWVVNEFSAKEYWWNLGLRNQL
jgi:alanine dehydrogenase